MKLEWDYKESKHGRYWLVLSNDNGVLTKILLIDCQNDPVGYNGVIRYKFNGVTLIDDIPLAEAMKEVEKYLANWWHKRYKGAERDYLESMEIINFLDTVIERD